MLSTALDLMVVPIDLTWQGCLLYRYTTSLNSHKVITAWKQHIQYSSLMPLQYILLLLHISEQYNAFVIFRKVSLSNSLFNLFKLLLLLSHLFLLRTISQIPAMLLLLLFNLLSLIIKCRIIRHLIWKNHLFNRKLMFQ
jgi:hypothetical protein